MCDRGGRAVSQPHASSEVSQWHGSKEAVNASNSASKEAPSLEALAHALRRAPDTLLALLAHSLCRMAL